MHAHTGKILQQTKIDSEMYSKDLIKNSSNKLVLIKDSVGYKVEVLFYIVIK